MTAREVLAEILRTNKIAPSDGTSLGSIDGWDSLKGVRLVLRLEEIVGRQLSESDIEGLQSLEDIDRLLNAA
jgi:acyl carrier protein